MMVDPFNFQSSPLNPGLKILVPLIFLLGTLFFYQARRRYGGELGKVTNRLFVAGIVGVLAFVFRYSGDQLISWKWGESVTYLLFSLANLYAVWPLLVFARGMQTKNPQPKATPASE